MFIICSDSVCSGLERNSEISDKSAETGRSGLTKFQQPASSSTFPRSNRLESGNGNEMCRNASTGELGGHGDVTGSSAQLPLRSISSSGAQQTLMRSEDSEGAGSEGELLNCLLRATGATAAGADPGGGPALRRRRRSNATDLETTAGVRERTASPVCVGGVSELGPRMATRRRSLPTPRLSVRDIAVPSCRVRPSPGTDASPPDCGKSDM